MQCRSDQLDPLFAFVLVIDVQERLIPHIAHPKRMEFSVGKLLDGAKVLQLPVLGTEQYPQGLGKTTPSIAERLAAAEAPIEEKPTFSAWQDATCKQAIMKLDRSQAILCGIETHVCVQQTALDMLACDFDVFLCADAVTSRSRFDHETALAHLARQGARVTTVESVLTELCRTTDSPTFKDLLGTIKPLAPEDE